MDPIPTFSFDDEIKEARENLHWAAGLNMNYILMNCLAAVLATYDLFPTVPQLLLDL